jgi:hypothetical protein
VEEKEEVEELSTVLSKEYGKRFEPGGQGSKGNT